MRRAAGVLMVAAAMGLAAPGAMASSVEPSVGERANTSCVFEGSDAATVDVVLLIDQSTSLSETVEGSSEPAIKRIGPAIGRIADRLNELASPPKGGVPVAINVGILAFGQSTTKVRGLEPLDVNDLKAKGNQLSSGAGLTPVTDYVKGLNGAADMFTAESTSPCKIMLWFTDGRFDLPNSEVKETDEPGLIRSAVCGGGSSEPLAARFRGLDVTSYVFLLQSPAKTYKPSQADVITASVETMLALTGTDEVTGSLPPGVTPPALGKLCGEFVTGEQAPDRAGRVVVSDATLADQLFVLINESIGSRTIGDNCPYTLQSSDESDPLPPPVFIDRIDVTVLSEGGAPGLVVSAKYGGTTRALQPAEQTSVNQTLTITTSELLNAQIAGGWTLEVSNPGGDEADVCVQMTLRQLGGALRVVPGDRELGPGATTEFAVDWSTVGITDPQGTIEAWTIEPDPSDSGTFSGGDSEGWFDASTTVATFTPAARGTESSIHGVVVTIRPKGVMDLEVPPFRVEIGELRILADEDAPGLDCSGAEVHASGEVPENAKPLRAGPCVLTPPADGKGEAQLFWKTDVPVVGGAPEWSVVTASGESFVSGSKVTEPLELFVMASSALPNMTLAQEGKVSFSLEWRKGGPGSGLANLPDEDQVPISIAVMKRADVEGAIWIAVIVALLAGLLSLLLLWLINSTTAKLPLPEKFFYAELPITIGRGANGAAVWSPQQLQFDVSSLQPPRTQRPGHDLSVGRVTIDRRVPPLWRPFKAPWAEASGAPVVRTSPGVRGTSRTPTSFGDMVIVSVSGEPGPSGSGQVKGVVTLVVPRSVAHNGLSERMRYEATRLLDDVGRELPTLEALTASASGPAPASGSGPSSDSSSVRADVPDGRTPPPRREAHEPRPAPPPPHRHGSPAPGTGAGTSASSGRPSAPPPPPRQAPPPPPR